MLSVPSHSRQKSFNIVKQSQSTKLIQSNQVIDFSNRFVQRSKKKKIQNFGEMEGLERRSLTKRKGRGDNWIQLFTVASFVLTKESLVFEMEPTKCREMKKEAASERSICRRVEYENDSA